MHTSFLQLGHLHIPIFGVFAALGLMFALTLSQRTARYAQLASEAVWNAGTTAILSTFAFSRLLLIVFNLHSFLQYPLLLLSLPSLTTTGVLLTAIFMLGYIRWRNLPLLPLLDAASPCAALLWAFLSLGEYLGGTRDGMPSSSGSSAPRPEPVELFTLIAASSLCGVLLGLLKQKSDQEPLPVGTATSVGLIIAGLAIFAIDFFRLPSDLVPNLWLDPAQIIGLAMILIGAPLLLRAQAEIKPESRNELPDAI